MKINSLQIRTLIFIAFLCFAQKAAATHNRAGEIWIEQIGPLTIRATVITYTKASSRQADRDTVEVDWGDGSAQRKVPRSNGNGKGIVLAGTDIQYNEYISTYTYPGRGTFVISMTDPNRNGGILNVNFPNSDLIPFHVSTSYTFLNANFNGTNTTPRLLQPPIDKGCTGKLFVHTLNAYDPDGDSIAYRLVIPKQDKNSLVPLYEFPDRIKPGINNSAFLDERTGQFTWRSPQQAGEYNVAFQIISYRRGVAIDTTTRDMQILIENCKNEPPKIETIDKLCVIAGTNIAFAVKATDPDAGQRVNLTALGGPFEVKISKATFRNTAGFRVPPVLDTFRWQTTCEHIAEYAYNVVFKAIDSFSDTTGLVDLKTVQIKVVGPPPEDPKVVSLSGQATVSWKKPYICEGAADNYFYAFSVWRRDNSNPFRIDTCSPGLEGKGYEMVAFETAFPVVNGRYEFLDKTVNRGNTYCYRVVAHFAKRTSSGNPFNIVAGLPSVETCVQLKRDVPLITHATVEATSLTAGRILVRWTKPVAKDLDTILNPPPYKYVVLRATGITRTGFLPIKTFTGATFADLKDTIWMDNALNTETNAYSYRIDLYTKPDTLFGSSAVASSHRLGIASSDRINILSWTKDVPWTNFRYDIYRLDTIRNVYDSIGTTTAATYTDRGLINKVKYCYFIKAFGSYSVAGIASPLENWSQVICGTPIDTVPPCPPVLTVTNNCDSTGKTGVDQIINLLRWTNPKNSCQGSEDVAKYEVFYADTEGGAFSKIQTITRTTDTTLLHQNLATKAVAGCYYVVAIDTVGNRSRPSNSICLDNCPIYLLPNAFTPNGDGDNEIFKPIKSRYIAKVEFKVFNRWGQLIFETDKPELNWDGKNTKGDDVTQGTYFYSCKVFEQRLSGLILNAKILSGYIELIKGN
jgi:gliding motility-associated-like protein